MSSSSQAGAAGVAALFAFFVAYFVVLIGLVVVVYVFESIIHWKLFGKGKQEPTWAGFVPIYRDVVMCKMVGINPWWILIIYLSSLLSAIPFIGSLLYMAVAIYYTILLNVSLVRAFGKEDTYAIGTILLPIVFLPMLAFGKSKFEGAKPMKDVVWEKALEILGKKK